ncbi:hypothetical protein ACQ4LE_009287 [Meloidogyne hapla]
MSKFFIVLVIFTVVFIQSCVCGKTNNNGQSSNGGHNKVEEHHDQYKIVLDKMLDEAQKQNNASAAKTIVNYFDRVNDRPDVQTRQYRAFLEGLNKHV